MESDIYYAKQKVDAGADYLVTQMFFDNEKYYAYVERCRKAGITVPIIPGIKPIVFKNQLNVLPKFSAQKFLSRSLPNCADANQTLRSKK